MATTTTTATERQARSQLICDHAEQAKRLALLLGRRCPPWVSREDLIGAAMIGLVEAAERYDMTREEPFFGYAERRVRGAIADELRRGDILPRRVRQLRRKVAATIARLEQTGVATDEAIATDLGVTVQVYREQLSRLSSVQTTSLEDAQHAVSEDAEGADVIVERNQALTRVRAALAKLAQRDAQILSMYYVDDLKYSEIAEVLGVTVSRVSQLMARALERCRAEIEDNGVAAA